MDLLLGIDVGTTNLKAVLYDLAGNQVAVARRATITHHPRPDWAVYDSEEIWQGIADAIRAVIAEIQEPTRVRGIAVASMGEAGVPLDENDQPLYPVIAWFDPRTEPQSRRWIENFGLYPTYRITGQTADPYLTLAKLLWLREHEPELFKRMRRWLCIEDWMIFRLTGEYATDYTIASRTMAFDQARRDWSEEVLAHANLAREIFPRAYPSGTVVGRVNARAAADTALAPGTPVVTGGHDHLVGALAAGVYAPGGVLDSTGTAESTLTILSQPVLSQELCRAHYACYSHVARNRYVLLSQLNASGGLLEWFIEHFCEHERAQAAATGQAVYDLVMAQIPREPGAHGVMLAPDLHGGSTPDWEPRARGAFFGVTTAHGKGEFLQAIIEATCYWLRVNLEFTERVLGQPIAELRAVGGAVRNAFWLQTKADVTGRSIVVPELDEATCLGAALLAGIGVGIYRDEADAVKRTQREARHIEPDAARARRYDELYPIYREGYNAARAISLQIERAFRQTDSDNAANF
jgi:xylulokinase